MKAIWIHAVSLGCNVLLASRLLQSGPRSQDAAPSAPPAPPDDTVPAVQVVASSPNSPPFSWATVESADYRTYIANLRAIGCPPETIRDLIVADVHGLYAGQRREIRQSGQWDDMQKQATLAESRRSEQGILDALLGPDWRRYPEDLPGSSGATERLASLDLATASQVLAIEERFEAETMAFLARTGGLDLEVDRAERREMEARKWAELASVLTPPQYVDYLKEHHPVANDMKVEAFAYRDEGEFLAVLAERERLENDTPASVAQAEARIETLLGTDRYAAYQRSKRPEYRELNTLARRFGLEEAVSLQVQDIVDRVSTVQSGSAATDPEVALASIQNLLGPEAFAAWRNAGFAPQLTSN